ncbi:PREDICTED: tectonic-1 [Cyprinodon variegatus]|uniref:tectonic-1 n=1 Tax=Cyprinodon variegatus TaxID=28743 RepID=UPI000742965C|nr:PREDICTED: tectonic-1 [Cyprinodon variegatus]
MAASVCSNVFVFCLFISIFSSSSSENMSMGADNSSELNSTSTLTDIYPTTEPETSPTESSYGPAEQPAVAADPLPLSGHLPSAQAGGKLSLCGSELCLFPGLLIPVGSTDIKLTFLPVIFYSGSHWLCSQEVARYSLRTTMDGYSQLQASVQKETNRGVFCIQSQNRKELLRLRLSWGIRSAPSEPPLNPSFHSLSGHDDHNGVCGGLVDVLMLSFQFGDVLATAKPNGLRGMFYLPAPGLTADCVKSPAGFLQDRSSRCSQRLTPGTACGSQEALRMDTYSSIQLLAGKDAAAAVVPVDVESVVLQSAEGAQTQLTISGGGALLPEAVSPSLCANVVLKVVFVIQYNRSGEVEQASVSLVLGFMSTAEASLQQEFQVQFIQAGGERGVHHSGNPGYLVGSALMSGDRVADGISRSVELSDALSVLLTQGDQDCLRGPHQRAPVRFGLDFVSGCTLRLEDVTNCSLVSQQLLDVLRGPAPPRFVASFGNSPLENVLDWVPIRTTISPTEEGSCSIPVSLHLEIEWTKYGSLQNPQAQIVTIREVIETNRSSLAPPPAGSSILPIRSSVAFIPVSAAALPGYRATPTIDAKLPFDFFFPFV